MKHIESSFLQCSLRIFSVSTVVMMLTPALCMANSVMFQANLERTGVYDDTGPEINPELVWEFDAGSAVFSTPLVYEDMVYFVNFEGGVYAVNEEDGSVKWEIDLGGQPSFQITLNEDLLLVGYHFNKGDGGYLMAVDRLTGEERWKFEANDHSGMDAPTIYNNRAYIVSYNYIFSLDLNTGEEVWRHPISGGDRQPLIYDGMLYFQDNSQSIYALSLDDGASHWSYSPQFYKESLFSTPAVKGCCIYALISHSEGRSIVKINRHDGQQKAIFPIESSSMSSVSFVDGIAFFGDDGDAHEGNNGYMNALDVESGELIWRFETDDLVGGAASIAGDTVYFGSYDHHLYAVNRYTGEMKWRYETDAGIASSPAIVDGRVYFGSIDGHVYVLE